MAVTAMTPTLRVTPRVAKWALSSVGADDAFEIGHNNPLITLFAYCTTGSVTLKFQISPDGSVWVDVPDSQVSLTQTQGAVKSVTISAHSIRPVVVSASNPFAAVAYVIAVRP